MSDQDKAYVGVSACGCVTFALAAGYESERAERAELERVLRSGRRIEVTTVAEARERMVFDCPHLNVHGDIPAVVDRLMALESLAVEPVKEKP